MIQKYLVYFKEGDKTPIISTDELPSFQMKSKKKYIGKKAKIEAIFRLSQVRLFSTLTTQQVNDYIEENFFNTPVWNDYHKIFKLVCNEIEIISEKYQFKYTLVAELDSSIKDIQDERLIHLLTCELLGQPLTEYQELKNPIVSLKKTY